MGITGSVVNSLPKKRKLIADTTVVDVHVNVPRVPLKLDERVVAKCPLGCSVKLRDPLGIELPPPSRPVQFTEACFDESRFATAKPVMNC